MKAQLNLLPEKTYLACDGKEIENLRITNIEIQQEALQHLNLRGSVERVIPINQKVILTIEVESIEIFSMDTQAQPRPVSISELVRVVRFRPR